VCIENFQFAVLGVLLFNRNPITRCLLFYLDATASVCGVGTEGNRLFLASISSKHLFLFYVCWLAWLAGF